MTRSRITRPARRLPAWWLWAALAGVGTPAVAAAPQAPYYAGIHLGQNNFTSLSAEVNFGGIFVPGRLQLDRGGHAGVMFGRRTENARFEVEYQQGRADISAVTLGPVSQASAGSARYELLTLNAYRTAQLTTDLVAFLGAGVGWGRLSVPRLGAIGACNCFAPAKDRGPAYQLRLGAEYQVVKNHHLMAQYSSIHLPGASSSGVPGVSYPHKTVGVLSVGYRVGF